MSSKTQNPGTGPARKRKQDGQSHCSVGSDASNGVHLQSNNSDARTSRSPAGKKNPNWRVSSNNMIEQGLKQYRSTEKYREIIAKTIRSAAELDRANALIRGIQVNVDPNAFHVCLDCDRATTYELCPCVIVAPVPQQQAPPPLPPVDLHANIGLLGYRAEPTGLIKRAAYWLFDWERPEYHLQMQNNQRLAGFNNSIISDQKLMPNLYNYIVNNLNVSYSVNGVEQRNLRLEHAKRLASRFVETNNIDVINDTIMSVRMRFTIQRATDQVENKMLYHETTPGQPFGSAWFPQSLMAWWRFMMLLCLIVLVSGTLIEWLSPMTMIVRLFTAIAVRGVKTILWQLIEQYMPIGSLRLLGQLTGTEMVMFALACVITLYQLTRRGGSFRRR